MHRYFRKRFGTWACHVDQARPVAVCWRVERGPQRGAGHHEGWCMCRCVCGFSDTKMMIRLAWRNYFACHNSTCIRFAALLYWFLHKCTTRKSERASCRINMFTCAWASDYRFIYVYTLGTHGFTAQQQKNPWSMHRNITKPVLAFSWIRVNTNSSKYWSIYIHACMHAVGQRWYLRRSIWIWQVIIYIYIYIYIHIYIYIYYTYMYIYMHLCVWECVPSISMYTWEHLNMTVVIFVCVCLLIYVLCRCRCAWEAWYVYICVCV